MRSPKEIINEQPVCPSNNKKTNARGLTLEEVKQLRDDFISAAIRAKKCGYDALMENSPSLPHRLEKSATLPHNAHYY